MTWAIKDWDKRFTCRQGKVVEDPRWVPVPNRHESERYKTLASSAGGMETFGVFIVLVQVASRCPNRGILEDDRGDLTPERLQVRTCIPSRTLARAMTRLAELGWLVPLERLQPDAKVSPECHSSARQMAGVCQSSAPPPRARDRPDQTREDQRRIRPEAEDSAAPPSGWLAGQTPDAMLAAIPIRDPARTALVNAGASCEQIKAEWIRVKSERLQGGKIENPEAVFITRMCSLVGIEPPKRASKVRGVVSVGKAIASGFSPDQMARLDRARRQSGGAG